MLEYFFSPFWDVLRATAHGDFLTRKITPLAAMALIFSVILTIASSIITWNYVVVMFPNSFIFCMLIVSTFVTLMFILMSFIGFNISQQFRPKLKVIIPIEYFVFALVIGGGLMTADSLLSTWVGASNKAETDYQTETFSQWKLRTNYSNPYKEQIAAIDQQIAGFQSDTYNVHDGSSRVRRNSSTSASQLATDRQELQRLFNIEERDAKQDWEKERDGIIVKRERIANLLAGFQWVIYLLQMLMGIPVGLFSIDHGSYSKHAFAEPEVAPTLVDMTSGSDPARRSNWSTRFWEYFNSQAARFAPNMTAENFNQIFGEFSADHPQISAENLTQLHAETFNHFSAETLPGESAEKSTIGFKISGGKGSGKKSGVTGSKRPKSTGKFGLKQAEVGKGDSGIKKDSEIDQIFIENPTQNIMMNLTPEAPQNFGLKYNMSKHEKKQANLIRRKYIAYVKRYGIRPMLKELSEYCGKDRDTVSKYIKKMQKDGQVLLRKRGENM